MTPNPSSFLAPADRAARRRTPDRVADILSDRIRSGIYSAGEPLPAERALAADLRVHRRSVRTAIDHLVQDGLVTRRPNCRPTVGRPSADCPDQAAPESRSRKASPQRSAPHQLSASNLIALIMWHGGGPLEHADTSQQRMFKGMNQSLMRAGYHAVFLDLGEQVGSEEENAAQEAEHLRYVRDQKFGGALFYPYAYRHNRELVEEVSRSVPLVLLDRKLPGIDLDFVGIENRGSLFQVVRHLIAQGHRRIAYVTHYEPIQSVQDRVLGYLDAMREPEAPLGNASDLTEMILTVPPHPDDRAWGVVDAVFRLPEGQRPTAAVCFTDYMAVSLAERLEFLGLSVPQDVALTGFDNIIPILPSGTGLTTVAQPYEEIGTAAVNLLLRRIHEPLSPRQSVELPVRLITRASSLSNPAQ